MDHKVLLFLRLGDALHDCTSFLLKASLFGGLGFRIARYGVFGLVERSL